MVWPRSEADLVAEQRELARARPEPWRPPRDPLAGGCFVCFAHGLQGPGAPGDRGFAGAALVTGGRLVSGVAVPCAAGAAYAPGLLALREGPCLAGVVRALGERPDVLLVDATGRDHPRRAGLALHLGAVLGLPTVGVTHRPLVAEGSPPGAGRGDASPLVLGGEIVGFWLRTRPGTRPLAVHAGWRTDPELAAELVLALTGRVRTPTPLREARRLARTARASSEGQ